MKMVYVLLDGVGDLPNPELNHLTPLEAAYTPNLDRLAKNGVMGRVYSVGKKVSPESDIAVFSMLGYRFKEEDYVGRGVIEALGSNMDFKDGDLALRGNFATIDSKQRIVDRRVGRSLSNEEAKELVDAIKKKVKLSNATFDLVHTTGHRVVLCIRSKDMQLSADISNTDPAYERIKGMGVAKEKSDMRLVKCKPLSKDKRARLAAELVNEFTSKAIRVMKEHKVNAIRRANNMLEANCILLRDAGNRLPRLKPIDEMYNLRFACIVDMPVEKGIAKALSMPYIQTSNMLDYESKASKVKELLDEYDAIYVHLKGPDEYGHDGDAWGKKRSIEDIDKRFFGSLLDIVDEVAMIISADHSTPCIKKSHSADPVPLLISSNSIESNGSSRFTESYAARGSLGSLMGYQVLSKAIDMLRS